MHVYAIGDIHGHLDLLLEAHALIADDMARYGAGQVVHVGDLVDRGADSRGVIDWLMAGIETGNDWVVLKGNHDRMFWQFMEDPARSDPGLRSELSWLHPRIGGAETLASYGVRSPADRRMFAVHEDALAAVPQTHRDFMAGLPAMHLRPGLIFVHAGIAPGVPLAQQSENNLLWIRDRFLDDRRDHGALVVHGHTAIDLPTHYGNRLNIDSGAAYGGPLTAVVIEDGQVFHLTHRGRTPITPV